MSGLIAAGLVLAAGAAVYAGSQSAKASKNAANQMRNGVQTFDPIAPNYQLTGAQKPQTVDWRTAVNDALSYDINHQQQAQQLAAQTNQFNLQQARHQYRTFQPYFDSLQRQVGQNALSFSQGELPPDVVANIGRSASQRGLAGGFGQGFRGGGTGTALGNSLLRGLGLTSLDLSKFGTQLAMQADLQAKQLSPPLYDPSALQVTPQQAIGYSFQNAQINNEAARYWNTTQNNALQQNTGAQNQANTNATNTELAGQLAQNQAIAQAGSTVGGGLVQAGMAKNQQQNGGYATNTAYIPSAATAGNVAGYGYSPGNAQGYYKLA